MIAKIKSNMRDRKLFTGIIVFAAMFLIAVVSIIGITVFGGNVSTSPIPAEVVLNGKTYTESNPFVILEIVPQEGLGELGYMVGGNSTPILSTDIQKISDRTNKTTVLNAWKDCVGCITGIWDRTKYSDDGATIQGFEDRDLFANSVFGNSDMTNKILVKSVAASSVTMEMVDSAAMVYINPGYHSTKFYEAYNLMAQYSNGNTKVSKKYNSVNTDSNRAKFNQNNISAQVALEIYIRSEEHGLAVVYDNSQTVWSNTSQNDNYSKLGQLLFDIEPDTFATEYASQCASGIYSGIKGSIGVYNSVLQIKRNSANVNWDCYMFVENNTPQYPYFNGGTRNSIYLNQNVLSYSGYNLMDMLFLGGGSTKTDSDSGTHFDIARSLYGTNSKGELTYTSMTRYIIGDSPSKEDFDQINVLEIEPCGDYTYNNFDGAIKIANYFGYNTKLLTQQNWTDHVNVRAVASNGFNGMNEDLAEKYDLIIVGSNNLDGKLLSPSTSTYSSKGAEINIVNLNVKTRYSGNDFTQKSATKVIDYAKTGKPIVLSKDLYFGSSKIDSSSNIYNLSIVKLRPNLVAAGVSDSNLMDEPDNGDSFRYLKRMVKPVIAITDNLKVKYNGDIATTTVSADSLSNLDFYGRIGTNSNTYNLVVSVDKNGNGLFATESSDDLNEVFYRGNVTTASDGSFSVKLQLPESLRGYVAWKAVVKDVSTGLSSEDLGGFVIEVREGDVKTVNLLQILPETTADRPITLNMKTNTQFSKLFVSAESASGIKINVTTITTRELENMYKNGNNYISYDSNNLLKNYSMIVFGFADSYGLDDISNDNGALNNIYDYIKKGNSVLFVHDTMSYSAYSDGSTDGNGNTIFEKGRTINPGGTGGFQLTSKFRYIIGADRYGASLGKSGSSDYVQGLSNEFLIKYGRTNENKSYSIFRNITPYTTDVITDSVNQLNQGQVTEFPYNISPRLSISPTHAQWFQLDLDSQHDNSDDVVVWYTLGPTSTSGYSNSIYYDYTGEDALNSYYIYSKGNVTYTGAGHSTVNQDGELKLFVNTVIRAILSGNSQPVIKVNNASIKSEGIYELFSRDNTKLPIIKFTATDQDLSKNTGKFESGLVYWDTDGNNTYNSGDILIKKYDSTNPIMNAKETEVDLDLYKDLRYNNATLDTYYNNNDIKIGLQVTDTCNSTGNATVSIFYRNLFELH